MQTADNSTTWDYGALKEASISCLKQGLDPQLFSAYIEPLSLINLNQSSSGSSSSTEIVFAAPTKFLCSHLDRNLKDKITQLLAATLGIAELSVKFVVDASLPSAESARPAYVVVKKIREEPLIRSSDSSHPTSGLNPRYTFDNFVVGRCNEFGHAAAMRVAEKPGVSYNPLFIYGGVGLGKTHLLHAIGNAILAREPSTKVLYLSSESFTNELIQSLRSDKMDDFKKKLRNTNVLLIDDIQFMSGKERTQEEFFHTFNTLYSAKRQIIITSDKIPQEIKGLEARLHSRFSWGLTADLQSPDYETRVAILKHKASLESLQLPEEVAHLISEKISSNIRELEGALTRLYAVSSLQKTTISLELARAALKPLFQEKISHISIDDIKKAIAVHFAMKVSDLVSKRRTKNLAFPRHIAMYLCRKHTSTSYPEIGNQFGGRDHSSVIHAANVISLKVATDNDVRSLIEKIERDLLGH